MSRSPPTSLYEARKMTIEDRIYIRKSLYMAMGAISQVHELVVMTGARP